MFSTLFSHTRAHPAQEPIEVEVGDFDHTPAPSPRPSLSMLRGNGDEASAVYEYSATPTSGYRHHLLKTLVTGPISLHKDVPVLPILSPTAEKEISPQAEKRKLQHGSQDKSTPVRESMATVSPSPSTSPQNKGLTPSIPATDRIRLESLFHLHDTHAREHVSSTLSPAGICDVDDLTQQETQVWPLPERNSASPVVYSMRDRKIDRHLSEEDKQITYSGAASFKHYPIRHQGWLEPGHPATSKVVPFKPSLTDTNRRSTENDGGSIYAQHQHQCDKLNAQSVSDMKIQIAATAEESPCLTPDQVSTPSQIDAPEALQSRSEHLVGSRVQACSSKTKPFIEVMREHGNANGTIGGEAHISARSNSRQHHIRECTPCQSEQDQSQADLASYVYAPMPSQESFDHFEQSGSYSEAGSDTSLRARKSDEQPKSPAYSSGRSQSLGSVLDYKRTTAQWLKGLVQAPEAYSARFTEIPARKRSIARPLVNGQRPSVLSNKATCHPADKSIHSGKSDPKIDGLSFKRAISDLERLLSEALTLASQVIDRSGSPNGGGCKRPSSSLHSGYRGRPGYREIDTNYLNDRSPTSERESAEDLSDFELSQQTTQVRPAYKHASTFAGPAERPRLAEIIENYSRKYEDLHPRSVDTRMHLRSQPSQSPGQSMTGIPTRNSRIQATQRPLRKLVNGEILAPVHRDGKPREENLTPVLNFNLGEDGLLGDKSLKKRPVGEHTPSAGRNATSQEALPERDVAGRKMRAEHGISLRRRSHVSLRNIQGFSLPKSHKRQPIARDWSPIRKRYVASVACLSTALIGILLGIYTGLVPSIQYYIVDQSHVAIHGNTGCFLGLALPTFFLWPLPLLHGRKPYIMASLILAMPLLFPQALAVNSPRLTNITSWRILLIASRTLMGCSLGFASMNFHSILTDLFGASLMSGNPHQEVVDQFDARRHGGGMGVWLGIWTWCWVGSLGIGFLIGASIIDQHPPAWGFYLSILLIAVVLLLNVICPEARRSSFRRSVAEVRTGSDISRRLARGEVMMHRVKTGPKWWGNEVWHGVLLSLEMLRQPGFSVMAVYVAWIYAQVVLVIALLGSLASRFYHLRSPYVGLHVAAMALGALFAIPFQKASIFSRSRHSQVNSSRETLDRTVAWSSHLIRRAVFTITLPLGAICYAAVSSGPPMSLGVPTLFAMCIGFLSCLAIAECNGLIMETFDTSDLSPGMIGRQRDATGQTQKKTNYSSFPRVTSGFAIIHSFAFILAAGSTALGGHITRTLGQRVASGVVASILFLLTMLLLLVLVRFKNVLIIPRSKSAEMDRLTQARRKSTQRRASMPNDLRALMEEDMAWRPVMIGNPVGKNRRVNLLELGCMTRWQDIRRKNKLIDESAHLNRSALDQGLEALDAALEDHMGELRRAQGLFSMGSRRNKHSSRLRRSDQRSDQSSEQTPDVELDTLDFGMTSSGPSHQRQFSEVECFMGQTVKEENEEEPPTGPRSSRKD